MTGSSCHKLSRPSCCWCFTTHTPQPCLTFLQYWSYWRDGGQWRGEGSCKPGVVLTGVTYRSEPLKLYQHFMDYWIFSFLWYFAFFWWKFNSYFYWYPKICMNLHLIIPLPIIPLLSIHIIHSVTFMIYYFKKLNQYFIEGTWTHMKNIIFLEKKRRMSPILTLMKRTAGRGEKDSGELFRMFRQLITSLNTG